MFYSRRKLLRDGIVGCFAGALTSALALTGYKSNKPSKPKTGDLPTDNSAGIEIFFVGAWIFMPDPDSPINRILALTIGMSNPVHHFPFGSFVRTSTAVKTCPLLD